MGSSINRDRNRELLAERLNWPDGAADECRELEARFPDYFVWWTAQGYPNPVPGFGAAPREGGYHGYSLYASDAQTLASLIADDMGKNRDM